jgi:chitinase
MRTSLLVAFAGCFFTMAAAVMAGCGSGGGAGATNEAGPGGGSPGSSSGGTVGSRDAGGGASTGGDAAGDGPSTIDSAAVTDGGDGGSVVDALRVVAYLPNYSGSYSDWATKIDFTKMTHLNLAFATATSNNDWDMGASDADVKALVDAAHAAGTKVLASLGGGGGDQTVIARYQDTSQIPDLVTKLDAFVAAHDFDGVDVDIEDPSNLGASYSAFVDQTVATLRPEGKLVTAAVAQYLQDNMADATLHEFDFLNVMIYSTYSDSVSALDYYSGTKSVPVTQLELGAGFFGSDSNGNEYAYSDILAADPSAWSKDQTQVNGNTVTYTGMASMKKLADYSKGFGGIMFWELSEDTSDAQYSLYKVIQGSM